MLRSMFIGISGMQANQQALSTISNNIANGQTVGYKMQEAVFEELFYQQYRSPVAPNDQNAGNNPMDVGNGVKVGTINTLHTQGNVTYTGNKTDMAIEGDGFFVLGDGRGDNRVYTRAGNFITSKNNELITKSGQYVLGWNLDPMTGRINTSASLEPIQVDLGNISQPIESTELGLKGNLDIESETGAIYGMQVPSYDRLGGRHDINFDFVKTGGNTFSYVATPIDQFRESESVSRAMMTTNENLMPLLQKGDYEIVTQPAVSGALNSIDISVVDPSGTTVFTQADIADVSQTLKLTDPGTGTDWFTIDLEGGGTLPNTATFTVGEVGALTFNATGQLTNVTGSGAGGNPLVTYTPDETGQPVNIDVNMQLLKSLATDSSVSMTDTDGFGAARLINYTITDGGIIDGYYDDGSVKKIAQVAMASFSNSAGLSRIGQGNFLPTPNSGVADVGIPSTGSRGQIKAQATETSNVDLAKQFTDLISTQKAYQGNTKVIQVSNEVLTSVIGLIR